jgi:hypothetical protein
MLPIVDSYVALSNIKLLSVTIEMQQCFPFELLSSYKTIFIAVNNINALKSSRKLSDIFVRC